MILKDKKYVSFADTVLTSRPGKTDFLFPHIMRHTNISQELNESFFRSLKAFANITFLWPLGT
jgi:hypothetical protein